MLPNDATIRVVSNRRTEALQLVRFLLDFGFSATVGIPDAEYYEPETTRDIIVVEVGHERRGHDLLSSLAPLKGNRTFLFVANLCVEEFEQLDAMGFKFINSAKRISIDSLLYLILQVDKDMFYSASAVKATRIQKSSAVQEGYRSLLKAMRNEEARPRLDDAKQCGREAQDLVTMSPMSVWLDLFHNHHDGTAQHCAMVSCFSLLFTRSLGFGETDIERIHDAAFFHDIGKAMVPLAILDKPGSLDEGEWGAMKKHSVYGYEILMRSEETAGEIARVARDHHEYLDGSGYPQGLRAAEIDDPTRILTICDVFAALVEARVYRPAKRPDEAFDILKSMAGTKLDPDLVRLFERVADDYEGATRAG